MDLKDKTVCVIEFGMFVEMAIRLSRDFGRTLYFSPWTSEYPRSKDDMIGYGIPGIERISSFWDYIDEIDLFVFPSIYFGDLQQHLVTLGKRVYGSRRVDELERDRQSANEYFKELGLPTADITPITGILKLRKYLQNNEDLYIKVSEFRGGNETWHHETYELSQPILDEMEHKLGPEKEVFTWICERPISGKSVVECGSDTPITVDGQFPEYVLNGYEQKDCCYLGRVRKYSGLSKIITGFNDAIAPTLKINQYRNAMSTEIRVGTDKKAFMIDYTARQPSPPGEIYYELIENYSQMVWDAAGGVLTEPKYLAKYAIEVMINSNWAMDKWQTIHIPYKIRKWVKLRNIAIINETLCVIPRHPEFENIGAVIAIGDSIDDVVEKASEYCKQIKGYEVECKLDDIDKIKQVIKKGEAIGLSF